MIINSSLIKQFWTNGVRNDFCPWKVYTHTITKEYHHTTESQLNGSYFETLCLGSGVKGQKVSSSMMRHKRNGSKTAVHDRIDTQHLRFCQLCDEHEIVIDPASNTQVTVYKLWKDGETVLSGDMDIFPCPVKTPRRGNIMSIMDLKLTGDLDSTFGPFSWGNPSSMDHTQAFMYKYLTEDIDPELNRSIGEGDAGTQRLLKLYDMFGGLHYDFTFFYWIFEHGPKMRNKFVEVQHDQTKRAELHESIRKTKDMIMKLQREGWTQFEPSRDNCSTCECPNCKARFIPDIAEDKKFENYEMI